MSALVTTFLSSFVFVFFKALQQLNVVHGRRLLIMPTSIILAANEVIIVVTTVATGYAVILPIGIGGGLGCLAAMSLYRRLNGQTDHP